MEAQNWKMAIGKSLNFKYRDILEDVVSFVADYSRRLAHPIKDLDDVRFVMAALSDIRHNEIRIDMSLSPIEVCCFGTFQREHFSIDFDMNTLSFSNNFGLIWFKSSFNYSVVSLKK